MQRIGFGQSEDEPVREATDYCDYGCVPGEDCRCFN